MRNLKYIFSIPLVMVLFLRTSLSVFGMDEDEPPLSAEARTLYYRMLLQVPEERPGSLKSEFQQNLENDLEKLIPAEKLDSEKKEVLRELFERASKSKFQEKFENNLERLIVAEKLDNEKREMFKEIFEHVSYILRNKPSEYEDFGPVFFQSLALAYYGLPLPTLSLVDQPLTLEDKKSADLIPTARSIYETLTLSTKGQDEALKKVATYAHRFLRINAAGESLIHGESSLYDAKPTMVLIGKTGSGKTSTMKHLSRIVGAPLVIVKATDWTPRGYINGKVGDMWKEVLHQGFKYAKDKNPSCSEREKIQAAESVIVVIDEFDKLTGDGLKSTEAAFYKEVQKELLAPIEGTTISVVDKESGKTYKLDTHKMLFACVGAFSGIKPKYGPDLVPQDLIDYGVLPEMAGRLTEIITLNSLSKEALVSILKESKTSPWLTQMDLYKRIYQVDLKMDDNALGIIAEKALEIGTGARALKSVINYIVSPNEFDIGEHQGKTLLFDKEKVQKALKDYGTSKKVNDFPEHLYT